MCRTAFAPPGLILSAMAFLDLRMRFRLELACDQEAVVEVVSKQP
jgi:hypothetical protein